MLKSNTQEAQTGRVDITDFGNIVVRGMLEYIYTGTTTIEENPAEFFLAISDKYGLDGLKESTENQCKSLISLENALYFYDAAIQYKAGTLEVHVVDFIKE